MDGAHILPNGDILFSPSTPMAFGFKDLGSVQDGDIVEWNGTSASLFMAESAIFQDPTSQSNEDIDALHAISATEIIFSVRSQGQGRIGTNHAYDQLDNIATDLLTYDKATGLGGEFLGGEDLFDGNVTRNLDAAFVPEPTTALLVALGLAGLGVAGRRRD